MLVQVSLQGWKALNALIKSYFFCRSNRGGFTATAAKKSKLLGIARWLQQRMMWYSGHGDALFDYNCADDNDDDSLYKNEDTDSSSNSDSRTSGERSSTTTDKDLNDFESEGSDSS